MISASMVLCETYDFPLHWVSKAGSNDSCGIRLNKRLNKQGSYSQLRSWPDGERLRKFHDQIFVKSHVIYYCNIHYLPFCFICQNNTTVKNYPKCISLYETVFLMITTSKLHRILSLTLIQHYTHVWIQIWCWLHLWCMLGDLLFILDQEFAVLYVMCAMK